MNPEEQKVRARRYEELEQKMDQMMADVELVVERYQSDVRDHLNRSVTVYKERTEKLTQQMDGIQRNLGELTNNLNDMATANLSLGKDLVYLHSHHDHLANRFGGFVGRGFWGRLRWLLFGH